MPWFKCLQTMLFLLSFIQKVKWARMLLEVVGEWDLWIRAWLCLDRVSSSERKTLFCREDGGGLGILAPVSRPYTQLQGGWRCSLAALTGKGRDKTKHLASVWCNLLCFDLASEAHPCWEGFHTWASLSAHHLFLWHHKEADFQVHPSLSGFQGFSRQRQRQPQTWTPGCAIMVWGTWKRFVEWWLADWMVFSKPKVLVIWLWHISILEDSSLCPLHKPFSLLSTVHLSQGDGSIKTTQNEFMIRRYSWLHSD